jgi:hypothetical protein
LMNQKKIHKWGGGDIVNLKKHLQLLSMWPWENIFHI